MLKKTQSSLFRPKVIASALAFLFIIAVLYRDRKSQAILKFNYSQFDFSVYCPIKDPTQLAGLSSLTTNYIGAGNNATDTYVVYVKSVATRTARGNRSINLTYCGLARPWLGTCQTAQIVCSVPGPMFYLPIKKPIYIIWINAIDSTNLNWPHQDCYASDSSKTFCSVESKNITSYASVGCSFQDPTNLNYKYKKTRISKNSVPINPHIHGLSIRPVFDGNPLSWFSNNGDKGVGFESLNNPNYFNQFQQVDSFFNLPGILLNNNVKIVRVQNDQPAGSLFYHDHSMRSTKFNVKYGLAGLYLLYDPNMESLLPQGNYQKFIFFSATLYDELRTANTSTTQTNPRRIPKMAGHQNHFDNIYRNVSFAVYYTNTSNEITEVNVSDHNYDLTINRQLIPFTLIGADSTLFNKPIKNITQFDLGQAQRVQFLIKFDAANGVPPQVNNLYIICYDSNVDRVVLKFKFNLQAVSPSNAQNSCINTDWALSTLNVPYTDLLTIKDSSIAVKRMKPFFSRPFDQNFIINGHFMYGMGASDLPQIGTTEDWYIVNNMQEAHPFHVHLVNFQVTQRYTLKLTNQGCTFYELDYYRLSRYSPIRNMTNAQLCNYLNNDITQTESQMLYHYLSNYYLENVTRVDAQMGIMTGFNVMQKIITPAEKQLYDVSRSMNCNQNLIYKYICADDSASIPAHYKRWKDTVLIEGFTVAILRIRWTKTGYDPSVQQYPYFNIPEQHLTEFPGYLYHCHILPHEDNEMMRPYMLQPSDIYLRNLTSQTTSNPKSFANWAQKVAQINADIGCK